MRFVPTDAVPILTIWGEARGESDDGMTAVGEVIRNRLEAGRGKTATEVCLASWQFSCWSASTRWRAAMLELEADDPIAQRCTAAWQRALNGSNLTEGATAYLNEAAVKRERGDGTLPAWARATGDPTRLNDRLVTARIGRHTFLKV